MHSVLLDSTNKINEYFGKNANHKSNSFKRNLNGLWQNYAKALGDFLPARESLKLSTDEMEKKTLEYMEKLNESENQSKNLLCKDVFRPYLEKLSTLANSIKRTSIELNDLCSKIDFDTDFINYAEIANYKLVDVELPMFKPFQFSNKYTMPDKIYIPRFRVSYFPVLAARAKGTFRSDSINEIPLQKGRIYFLMEKPRDDLNWILIMSCGWKKVGFAPYAYIEVVGNRVGVIKTTFPRNGYLSSKQRFVAVLKKNNKSYTCIDENNVTLEIPKTQLYLL